MTALVGCGGGGDSDASGRTSATTSGTTAEAAESSEHFTRDNWDVLNSDPEGQKGASVDIVGQVFLTPERDQDGVYFQMYADPKNAEWNTVVGYADPTFRVKADDFVRVRGTVSGKFEGENAFGADLTVPVVLADSVKVVDAVAAASPAIKTLPRQQQSQAGITTTVQKVEFAEDETRVFVAIKNGSSAKYNFYSSSALAVQRGRQYESTYSGADYPELSSTILPGAYTSGVIVFPKMRPKAGLDLHLEGSSSNYDVGDYGTLTWRYHW
jgi:hypothetical protein